MIAPIQPESVLELAEAVRATPKLIPVGAGTKPALASAPEAFRILSLAQVRGILEYEPAEYTITALAGTPIRELADELARHGQYLPFDPLLAQTGATLGGTIASGCSGPGRFRFGGVRDFILGVRFVDGAGRTLRVGGKVVKNAAGFDVPKFLVGSFGRFGVLAEATVKVFPRPESLLTVQLRSGQVEASLDLLTTLGKGRWQPDALDLLPEGNGVCVRLAGPSPALPILAKEILSQFPGEILPQPEADRVWSNLTELRWAPTDGVLIRSALSLGSARSVLSCVTAITGARAHVTGGGNAALIWLPGLDGWARLDAELKRCGLGGVILRGSGPLLIGNHPSTEIAERVKTAFDPEGRFPAFECPP